MRELKPMKSLSDIVEEQKLCKNIHIFGHLIYMRKNYGIGKEVIYILQKNMGLLMDKLS